MILNAACRALVLSGRNKNQHIQSCKLFLGSSVVTLLTFLQ